MTLEALAGTINFSAAHISLVERAQTPVSQQFVAACDEALEADGALLELLPAAVYERAAHRHRNQALRRQGRVSSIETGDEATEESRASGLNPVPSAGPVTGEAAMFGGSAATSTAPSSVVLAEAGSGFVTRWQRVLEVFVTSERVLGARPVITAMAAELPLLRAQREAARAETRTELLRAESRWAEFVSWLADNIGSRRSGRQWIDRARDLAREADDRPMVAYVLMRKSQQALEHGKDARSAVRIAEAAQRERELPPLVHALSAVREAQGHAILRERVACVRKLDEAHELIERPIRINDPWWINTGTHCTHNYVQAYEGHCWLLLEDPSRAIACFEQALESWPGIYRAEEAVQRARLATAHAANNDPDRAAAEGQRALVIHEVAPSSRVLVELARLDQQLARWPSVAEIHSFREGFTTARRDFDVSASH